MCRWLILRIAQHSLSNPALTLIAVRSVTGPCVHGLNIVEPVEEASGPAAMSAKVVNLASWSDDDCRSSLELHEPQATDIVIALGYRH
jgi:hypothetical protein